jgi:hypothetical protein
MEKETPMVECRSPFWWICVAALLTLALAAPRVASALTWKVKVTPPGSGKVTWMTTAPLGSGVIDTSGKISVDENEWVDLTFEPNPGYKLFSVYKDSDNWTPFLDPSNHFTFGPVSHNHKIKATFPLLSPTGTFLFEYPLDSSTITAIVDITGNFTGVVNGPFRERSYEVDVAMDEHGKLVAMGTVDGIEPLPGGDPLAATGRVKTVDDQPLAQVKTKFEGTVDGVPASCKASGESPMEVKDLGGENAIEGTHTYKATYGGVKFKDKDRPLQVDLDPASVDNIAKDWSLTLAINEQTNPKNGKTSLVADSQLDLQNWGTLQFSETRVKQSKKGAKLSGKDENTIYKIDDLKVAEDGGGLAVTGGWLQLKTLGQMMKAYLPDFFQP